MSAGTNGQAGLMVGLAKILGVEVRRKQHPVEAIPSVPAIGTFQYAYTIPAARKPEPPVTPVPQPDPEPLPVAAVAPAEQTAVVADSAPMPAAQPEQANQELATVMSVSQVLTTIDCSARYFFRYFRGLPDITDAKRALGKAVHAAIAANFRHKLETGQDLEREKALEIYAEEWKKEAAGATFAEDDDQAALEREGAVLLQKYLTEAAPSITPVAVEQYVEGVVGGVRVRGYVDLMDSNGCIYEFKTAKAKPSGIKSNHRFQGATYTRIMSGASGKVAIHTLVRTKTPQLVKQEYTVNDADVRFTETMFPLVQESCRGGVYVPNRNSMFCSRSDCAYWSECEKEFGGEVKE